MSDSITTSHIAAAESILGIPFTPANREQMLPKLNERLAQLDSIRSFPLDNSVAPALRFDAESAPPARPQSRAPTHSPPNPL